MSKLPETSGERALGVVVGANEVGEPEAGDAPGEEHAATSEARITAHATRRSLTPEILESVTRTVNAAVS